MSVDEIRSLLAGIVEMPRPRWFVQIGGLPQWDMSFHSKQAASTWINSHGHQLDWRVGFVFRLKEVNQDIEIVDASRRRATATC